MQIGTGLPATIPGVRGEFLLDWARRADDSPFSSLGIIDRLVYPSYEPLVTLAAAAGATKRIRLMTTILITPIRNAVVLAKQAASLNILSGGRLTLGLGLGTRADDYRAASVPFDKRGQRFEEQLALMKRIWSGQPLDVDIGPIGPLQQREPEVLIGGYSPIAIRRVGRWGDGFIFGGAHDPAARRQTISIAEEAWKAAGRPGKPRLVATMRYALGPNALERAGTYVRDFYTYYPGPRVEMMVKNIAASPEAIKATIQTFVDIGLDELLIFPSIPEMDQFDRLVQVLS